MPGWVLDFVQTPGFAGLLAVVAAVIAYLASTRNSRRERWWKRAEYALNLTLSDDEAVQLVGLAMLRTLRSRDRREQDFIKAATDLFLDPDADGTAEDDLRPGPPEPPRTSDPVPSPQAGSRSGAVPFLTKMRARIDGILRRRRR